jgi:hypothetical protein
MLKETLNRTHLPETLRMHRSIPIAATLGLLIFTPHAEPQEPANADEQIVKAAGVATDTAAILRLFADRTLKDEDRKLLEGWVRLLDSDSYEDRDRGHAELLRRGPLALPFLKNAIAGKPPLELRRRAEELIRKIEAGHSRDTMAAAARLLAVRNAEGGIEALLRYLPNVDDPWLDEEVLTSLGRLAVKAGGEPDAKLLAALKDPVPARRAGVLYLLGRRANAVQRGLVRSYLADADPLLRERAAQGLLGKRALQSVIDGAPADDATLKTQNISPTEEALLDFLRKRTPDAAAQGRLAAAVPQLGSLDYTERQTAAETLVKAGNAALAFLQPALLNPDAEVARRARRCIDEIQRGPGPAVPIAVVRRLASPDLVKDVPAALRVLLGFVPFAEDESVEDELLNSLTVLSTRQVKVDPCLATALDDALPARRAAAAYALGCVGTEESIEPLRKRLADVSPSVRLRAAQGLLAVRDKTAVPTLIALLGELPPASLWRIEEVMNRLAGDQAPADVITAATPAAGRQKIVQAWQAWWKQHEGTLDLACAGEGDSFLGLVTVCEYDSVVAGRFSGQVWEAPRNGTARFKFGNLVGPMDAQTLPNGRILVAENGANRVSERDREGNVKWEFNVVGSNPICCQRLPNGNTFIAMYNQLLEVRPDKSEVYRYNPGQQFYIFGARKTRTGTVVCITAQGALLEIDPLQNKTLRNVNLGQPVGGWSGIEPLPNGNCLVAIMNNNTIREVDAKGTTVWSVNSPIPGVFRATRLPNGNLLVVSMNTREVAELDRTGAVRWRQTCQGRPWSVHYR